MLQFMVDHIISIPRIFLIDNWNIFLACDCLSEGTVTGTVCDATSGNCTCNAGYTSSAARLTCDICDAGYYDSNLGNGTLNCIGTCSYIFL